jgi:hypothetical protein
MHTIQREYLYVSSLPPDKYSPDKALLTPTAGSGGHGPAYGKMSKLYFLLMKEEK